MVLRQYMTRMTRETVVVHTTTGASLRGVLMSVHKDCIVLEHARYLSSVGTESIDGEAIVPRGQVAWLQRLPAEGSDL